MSRARSPATPSDPLRRRPGRDHRAGRGHHSAAIQYPNRDRHDQQINSYAVPVLNAEAVDAQSAHIDAVSGATYTSVGYVRSLQSAIDEAFQ